MSTTIAPVDTSSFTPAQMTAFNAANALGNGVQSSGYVPPPPAPVNPAPTPYIQAGIDQANNQGKPGYDVLGNKIPTAPPVPVTSSSSDTAMNTYTPQNKQNLAAYQNAGLAMDANGFATTADGKYAEAPSSAVANANGGYTDPNTGINYYLKGLGAGQISSDPMIQKNFDDINALKAEMDSSGAAMIQNIQDQFKQLIQQQGDVNTRANASLNQSLLMSGSSRYSQESSTGQTTALMSYGIQQIATLNQKEMAAVTQAQQALESQDYQLLDKQMTIIQKARDDKQAAAQNLADKLTKINDAQVAQKKQQGIDTAIGAQLSNGVTDPSAIIKALNAQGLTVTAKDVSDSMANLSPDAKTITDIMTTAAKNGANQDTLKAIGSAKSAAAAITAAGSYVAHVDPTSNEGMYAAYVARTQAKGLTPMSAESFLLQNKTAEAYATQAAKNQSDANFVGSAKNQQNLEQQYRQVLTKEFSARTGSLGIENAKVAQGNHLNSMFMQYYDPKTGNYNIPTAQYAELAIGLANMISPTGQSSDSDRAEIKSKTAAGDIKGAIQYITGEPQNGNTQAIIKNLVDSVDRQAETATRNREAALGDMKALAPTGLDPARVDALNKATQMVPYEGESRISKSAVDSYVKANPAEAEAVAKLYEVPGATDQDIEAYLKAQGKI